MRRRLWPTRLSSCPCALPRQIVVKHGLQVTPLAKVSAWQLRSASTSSGGMKWFSEVNSGDVSSDRTTFWRKIVDKHKKGGESILVRPIFKPTAEAELLKTQLADACKIDEIDDEFILQTLAWALGSHNAQGEEAELMDARIRSIYGLYLQQKIYPINEEYESTLLPGMIDALIRADRRPVLRTFFTRLGSGPQALQLWKLLLFGHLQRRDIVGFLETRQEMTNLGLGEDVAICNIELDLLCNTGHFEAARVLYDNMPCLHVSPDWASRHIMLNACQDIPPSQDGHAERLAYGHQLFQVAETHDLRDNGQSALAVCCSWLTFRGDSMEEVQAKVKQYTVEHKITIGGNEVRFMLYGAYFAERWHMLERICKTFAAEVEPSPEHYSLRISAATRADDRLQARDIYEEAKKTGFQDLLWTEALLRLIEMEVKAAEPDEAFMLDQINLLEQQREAPFPAESLEWLVPTLMQRKHFELLESILEGSKELNDWKAENVIAIILAQLPDAKDSNTVWNYFSLLKNLFWNEAAYNLQARFATIQRLVELEQPKVVGQMFSQFLKSDIKPDEQFYINTLQYARQLRDFDLIRRIHQFLKMDINIASHSAILNTLMNAYAYVNSSLTFDIWEQIYKSGVGPTNASVSIILDGCTYAHVPQKGRHIWSLLERRGFPFNDNNFASMVEMLNKHAQTDEAMQLLGEAIEQGKQVGERAVSTLYNTSCKKAQVAAWAEEKCPAVWTALRNK